MYPSLLFVGLLAAASSLSGVDGRNVTVTVQNSTLIGNASSTVDSFYGIPYAEPPVGTNRLKRPVLATALASDTFVATGTPTACPQLASGSSAGATEPLQGEDCLNLNIQRPAGVNATSKLPVLFWIYGGAFEVGWTGQYDGSLLVEKSISLGHPVVFVAINYRVNAFGFLSGGKLQEDGVTNLGLRDQRVAMQWVQENIAAFGGDPDKVTIFGESAGGMSVCSHTIIDGGSHYYNSKPLFRAAIMSSGSVLPADDANSTQANSVYNQMVSQAGCSNSTDTLDCLRNVPYETFLNAVNSFPNFFSYSSLAFPFMPRADPTDSFYPVSPDVAIEAGNFSSIPVIAGDQQDEGTIFALAQTNITTTSQLVDYAQMLYPNAPRSIVDGLVASYSADPDAGSPFGTDNSTLVYSQFKKLAAILGDVGFTLQRRNYLQTVSRSVPAWSYLDSHLYGNSYRGTYHSSDTETIFNTTAIVGTSDHPVTADTFRTHYISFTNYMDPNTIGNPSPLIYWPRYTTWDPVLLNLRDTGNTLIQDDFRQVSAEYLAAHASELRL